MNYIISIAILSLSINALIAQIDFENKCEETGLYRKVLSADSAIKKGEYGEIHSLLIIKDGKLFFEKYYNNWPPDSLHQLQSATKSLVATLLGCALQAGIISSVDNPLLNFFPKHTTSDSLKKKITIKDLLTQRHGLKWSEGAWTDPNNSWRKVISTEGDWYENILSTTMDTLPGIKFNYSNAAPLLISGLIQNASDMRIDSFAKKYLFDKLDITQFWFWQGNGGPQNNGMALIALTSRDMAKIAQLYLQSGKWNGHQILSKEFVTESTSAIVKGVGLNGFYKQYDYGYFWWSNPVSQNDQYTDIVLARGAGGQNIIIDRKRNMVIVITAWNMQQPNKPQRIYDQFLSED